jgi:RNA polymerase sigma factor (TIGR02999 family)
MATLEPRSITRLLVAAHEGDRAALDRLIPLVYAELRDVARRQLRREASGHTLDSVALVHEAYLKLVQGEPVAWQSRAHFFGIASRAMRAILVDHARSRGAAKRGGGVVPLELESVAELVPDVRLEAIGTLDDALVRLARVDEEASRAVECRYFGGLTLEETAAALGLSVATTRRRWAFAKAWLRRDLSREAGP